MRHVNDEFTRWLKDATKGLPPDTGNPVRDEIEAHYLDAVQDYVDAGMSGDDAHHAAMTDLGDARSTAQALRETHLAPRRYIQATVVALLFLVIYAYMPMALHTLTGSEIVTIALYDIVTFAFIFYLLDAFRRLASEKLKSGLLNLPVALVIGGLCADTVGPVLSLAFFGVPTAPQDSGHTMWDAIPPGQSILEWLSVCGVIVAGVGLFMLGQRLLESGKPFYGLRKSLAYLFYTDGAVVLAFALTLVLSGSAAIRSIATILSSLTFILHMLIPASLVLVFFRAVYRKRQSPMQAA